MNSSHNNQDFIQEQKEKSVQNSITFTVIDLKIVLLYVTMLMCFTVRRIKVLTLSNKRMLHNVTLSLLG